MDNDDATRLPDNWVYYAQTGNGVWTGSFSFSIVRWKSFWKDRIGFWNRFFSITNHLTNALFGPAQIHSVLKVHPLLGPCGVITNVVSIRKFGITLYVLDERYVLHLDGTGVYVHSKERFGPFPFLFRFRKRHPAKIITGGMGATYLDMPILGTLWEGKYKVSETKDSIIATLRCEWAEGREEIKKISSGPAVLPSHFLYPNTISEAITALERYRDWFNQMKDPRATFAHAYVLMTKFFASEIPRRAFLDRNWILEVDILFVREYLKALHEYEQGLDTLSGWHTVFKKIMDKKTSVFEELILSMAAHIVQDLPFTLIQSDWRGKPEADRIHDFHLANDILGDAIDHIQDDVGKAYNPFLQWLDQFARNDDEILTNYGIRLSRGMAWYNAVRLISDPENITRSLARSVDTVVQKITDPPFSLYFVLRAFRFVSRISRRWPKVSIKPAVVKHPGSTIPLPASSLTESNPSDVL